MARAIWRFIAGFVLPLKGGLLALQHRHLLALAVVPLILNLMLYLAALALVVHYYEEWFGLLFAQPQAWYWLVGYVILRLVAFALLLAALLFSFVFVGTALAAPFLEVLSARVERVLQGQDALTPVRPLPWLRDLVRALGHAFLLLLRLSSWSYSCHWSGWCCCRLQLWGAHCSYWRLTRDTRSEFRLCPPRLRSGARTWWV